MAIKEAGFQNVQIMGETAFPMEFMANDPHAKEFIEHLRILLEKKQRWQNRSGA